MVKASPSSPEIIAALVQSRERFLAFLGRRLGSAHDAEEILQAAFVKAIEKSGALRTDENIQAWFYRLLRNAVIDHYRGKAAERRALGRVEDLLDEAQPPDLSVESAICQCVHDLLPTINQGYADLLRRVDMEGENVVDVARETDRTANNVRVTLHRARKALRKQIEMTCGACAEHACLDCTCHQTR